MQKENLQTDPAIADRMRAMHLLDRLRDAQVPPRPRMVEPAGEPKPDMRAEAASVSPFPGRAAGASAPADPARDTAPLLERFEKTMARGGERFDRFLDRLLPDARPPVAPAPQRRPLSLVRPVPIAGMAILVAGLCAVTWAALAPPPAAAVAAGVIGPEAGRRTIQPAQGGIVREVLVHDGDRVAAGQALYRIDVAPSQSTYAARREQWLRLLATRARLEALATDADRMSLPAELTQATGTDLAPDLVSFIKAQADLLDLRRRGLDEREEGLRQQLRHLDEQVRGRRLEAEGLGEQLALLQEDLKDKQTLAGQRSAKKPETLAIQRGIADVRARIGANIAEIAALEERSGEIRQQLGATRMQVRTDSADQLAGINKDIAQAVEAMVASREVLAPTTIVAPAAGTIVNQRPKVVGAVVQPGEPVADLVPREDPLVMDARLPAAEIDTVKPGLPALVHVMPSKAGDTPMLDGTVIHVGADSTADRQTGQRYYDIKVQVDRSALDKLARPIALLPGMPVEVHVGTRNRSALASFVEPITWPFRHAFRDN